MMLMMAAARNMRFQPAPADSADASGTSGTSSGAVPLAVYGVPEFPAAYLLPKVSAQVARKIDNISPQNRKISAAKVRALQMQRDGRFRSGLRRLRAKLSRREKRGKENVRRLDGRMEKQEGAACPVAQPGSGKEKLLRQGSCRDREAICCRQCCCPRFRTDFFQSLAVGRENSDPPFRSSIAVIHTCMRHAE